MLGTIELLFSLFITWFAVFRFNKYIKENKLKVYITTACISVIIFILMILYNLYYVILPEDFYSSWYLFPFHIIANGYLGAAIWSFVMIASVYPKKNIRSKLMFLRTELSIIGFIVSLPQAIEYTGAIFVVSSSITPALYLGVFMMLFTCLFVILGITSFESVKNNIGIKKWRKIHKLAHLFYFILFIELILISVALAMHAENTVDTICIWSRTIIYTFIYLCNLIFRIKCKSLK